MNEVWFRAEETGTYFGRCAELCGKDHGFMPVVVDVVEPEEFNTWVAARQTNDEAASVAAAD